MNEPTELRAGLTATWTESISDYPATDYTLKYNLVNATVNKAIVCTASGNDHVATLASTESLTAGEYTWQSYVVSIADATIKYFIASGKITILGSFLTGNTDFRTHARTTLDAIEAVIESRATKSQQSISIGGRSVVNMTFEELIKARSHYAYMVKQEETAAKIAAGLEVGNKILVRF